MRARFKVYSCVDFWDGVKSVQDVDLVPCIAPLKRRDRTTMDPTFRGRQRFVNILPQLCKLM